MRESVQTDTKCDNPPHGIQHQQEKFKRLKHSCTHGVKHNFTTEPAATPAAHVELF